MAKPSHDAVGAGSTSNAMHSNQYATMLRDAQEQQKPDSCAKHTSRLSHEKEQKYISPEPLTDPCHSSGCTHASAAMQHFTPLSPFRAHTSCSPQTCLSIESRIITSPSAKQGRGVKLIRFIPLFFYFFWSWLITRENVHCGYSHKYGHFSHSSKWEARATARTSRCEKDGRERPIWRFYN